MAKLRLRSNSEVFNVVMNDNAARNALTRRQIRKLNRFPDSRICLNREGKFIVVLNREIISENYEVIREQEA